MILGMKLLYKAKIVSMLHLRINGIMDEKAPCIILVQTAKRDKGKTLILLVVQIKKDLKYDDETYLVAIREVQGNILIQSQRCLQLTQKTSQKSCMWGLVYSYHQGVKLAIPQSWSPIAKPPAMAPYQMAITKFRALRKQLNEMLESASSGYQMLIIMSQCYFS